MLGKDGGTSESDGLSKDEIPKNDPAKLNVTYKKITPTTPAPVVAENDKDLMARFLKSRGIDPRYITHQGKAANGRTGDFQRWKRHIVRKNADGSPLVQAREACEMSPKAKILKNAIKKKISEELYDRDKDDKTPVSANSKPEIIKDRNMTNGKQYDATAVLTGGKTETGKPRDVIEIEPALRSRPGIADFTPKNDKKLNKKP